MSNKPKLQKIRIIGLMVAIMEGAKIRFIQKIDKIPVSVASNVQIIDVPVDFYGALKGVVRFTEQDIKDAKRALAEGMGSDE